MACEKYANWISDAALDRPHRKREAALLLHVSVCPTCAEKLRHAQSLRSLVDRGVEATVAGDPSPQFVARVRSRIATAPAPGRATLPGWAPAGIVAASLAVLLAVWALRAPRKSSGHFAIVASQAPVVIVHEQARPAIPPLNHAPPRSKRSARSSEPEVLVPPGQLALALQLSQGLVSGRMNGEALFAAQKEFEKPVEITPSEKDSMGDLIE